MQNLYSLQKIISPALPPTTLHREALVTKLQDIIACSSSEGVNRHSSYKLVLLHAPAGYGKTTLLADFAQHTRFPCCWYFLDHTDGDTITFFRSIIESIRHHFPSFGTTLDTLLSAAITSDVGMPGTPQRNCLFEQAVDALSATIADEIQTRFALVLCNYHEVNKSNIINELMNRFIRQLPPQCVLVIESRAIPDLDFTSLIVHRQIFSLSSQLLRFLGREIQALACIQGKASLSYEEAEHLALAFDGWIAGILLGTHLGDVQQQFLHTSYTTTNHEQGSPVLLQRRHLFAYLVKEAFRREPDAYCFLKEASILQRMIPSFCTALLGTANAATYLQYLEQQGLFVTHSNDGKQLIYMCHPILRELLCQELYQQSPERFLALHRRAADLFYDAQDYVNAVYHAFEAHDEDLVLRLILEVYEPMFLRGFAETLARWIDALAAKTLSCQPKLILMRANLYLMLGEYTQAIPLLEKASEVLTEHQSHYGDEVAALQISIALAYSKAQFQGGNYHQAQELCQQTLSQFAVDDATQRADVHTLLGVCSNLLGDLQTGILQLQKALQLLGRNTGGRQTADLHSMLASTYSLLGNFALSEHHLSLASKCWDELHDEWGKINNILRMGLIKQRQGLLSEAEDLFARALTDSRCSGRFRRGEAYALVNLGEVYQDQEMYAQSLSVIEEGLALSRQIGDKYLTNCALCILAMTYLFMDDAATALLMLSETERSAFTEHANNARYEQTIKELTYGTILLYQHRYDDAYINLTTAQKHLTTMGLKRELLQATLRLAACQFKRDKTADVVRYFDDIAVLTKHGGYGQLVRTELHRLPELAQEIRALPEAVHLQAWLPVETPAQETESSDTSPILVVLPNPPITATIQVNSPNLQIRGLGEATIFLNGAPITRWRLARALELCFFLLDSGRPITKEHIIDALWTEVEDQVDKKLRMVIYYLRKTLGESCVVFRAAAYSLDFSAQYGDNVWYDVTAFQNYYTQAKEAHKNEDEATARELLLKTVDLYHGNFLQSLYSNWCRARRDELQRNYLDARHSLALIAWQHKELDESIHHWQNMLVVDNCLEEAHCGLIRCYLLQKKRGLAIRQYQKCVQILQDELHIQTGQNLQNLYRRFLTDA